MSRLEAVEARYSPRVFPGDEPRRGRPGATRSRCRIRGQGCMVHGEPGHLGGTLQAIPRRGHEVSRTKG